MTKFCSNIFIKSKLIFTIGFIRIFVGLEISTMTTMNYVSEEL